MIRWELGVKGLEARSRCCLSQTGYETLRLGGNRYPDHEGRLLPQRACNYANAARKVVVHRKTHPAKGQDSYFRRLEELGVLGADNFTTLLLRQM